jgi:hypothetical protein
MDEIFFEVGKRVDVSVGLTDAALVFKETALRQEPEDPAV